MMHLLRASIVTSAAVFGAAADGPPVIQLHMYRGMMSSQVGKNNETNDDLADLHGVLKYIHTECIAEHEIARSDWPTTRKYSIDTIVQLHMKILNPPDLTKDGTAETQNMDFGPFITYDFGQQTNEASDDYINTFGDFVGLQQFNQYGGDPRYNTSDPYYWYSVSGACPNLPWECAPSGVGSCKVQTPPVTTARCEAMKGGCPGKFDKDGNPSAKCLTYSGDLISKLFKKNYVKGGLCPDGNDKVNAIPSTEPTGEAGCVYTYGKPKEIDLDALAGITAQECQGGQKCKNFGDFRRNCKDKNLRRSFNAETKKVQDVGFCVEYDIHPDCAADCTTAACQAVDPEKRELGLPFWQGRCDVAAGRLRAEALASMAGITGATTAHKLVDDAILSMDTPCIRPQPISGPACDPSDNQGGPYCSRAFSGVCAHCYIPGTKGGYPNNATEPMCPLDVLNSVDYQGSAFPLPNCDTQKPSDLCCLYLSPDAPGTRCDGGGDAATFDIDGFYLTLGMQSTEKMEAFLEKIASSQKKQVAQANQAAFKTFAYNLWDIKPIMTTFEAVQSELADFLEPAGTPTTPPGDSGSGGGMSAGLIVVIVLVVIAVLAGGGFVVYKKRTGVAPTQHAGSGLEVPITR